jgi:biotin carboxylase
VIPRDGADDRPTLAYVFDPGSFAILALFEAAQDVCNLLWVADTTRPGVAELAPMLRRLGTLEDVAGLSVPAAADAIAAHGPAGILALADDQLRLAADLAEALGLAFHSPATARRLTDKFEQRRALAAAGLAAPRSWVLPADDPMAALPEAVPYPVVLKPRRGEGSRDTFRADGADELRTAIAAAVGDGGSRDLVVEEYIADGDAPIGGIGFANYVSVESYVDRGTVVHVAVNGRTPPAFPFRETGFFIPSALDEALEREVRELAGRAAAAVGVEVGCLHTEVKLTPTGPVVIEVNGRIGGGVPELLAAAAGVRLLPVALRLALGDDVEPPVTTFDRVAYLLYVHAPPALTEVTAVEGIDELERLDEVDEVVLRRGPGARVDWREGNHGHVLSVFGTVADHDALRAAIARVESTLRIEGT